MTGYVIGRGGANIKNASSIQGIKTVKVNSDTNMVTIIAEVSNFFSLF